MKIETNFFEQKVPGNDPGTFYYYKDQLYMYSHVGNELCVYHLIIYLNPNLYRVL